MRISILWVFIVIRSSYRFTIWIWTFFILVAFFQMRISTLRLPRNFWSQLWIFGFTICIWIWLYLACLFLKPDLYFALSYNFQIPLLIHSLHLALFSSCLYLFQMRISTLRVSCHLESQHILAFLAIVKTNCRFIDAQFEFGLVSNLQLFFVPKCGSLFCALLLIFVALFAQLGLEVK